MAFKQTSGPEPTTPDPAVLFKTLTQRTLPDVMPHQKETLENYARSMTDEPDVALQLPTGSGKTLVGLLIGEWRRRNFQDRVVYLCPTKQLVHQTVNQSRKQYGIDAIAFAGSKHDFPASHKTAYRTGANIAVTTYSGLFNTHPYFMSPDVIIVDDAHAAENYIANMWSLQVDAQNAEHSAMRAALVGFLQQHIGAADFARLTGQWHDSSDTTWVDKLPSTVVVDNVAELTAIFDAHSEDHADFKFPWMLLREHLHACHLYFTSRQILIRPLIPPTWTHDPFNNAGQRLYMSATLGEGGDLERLTGRASIRRLPAPEAFQSSAVGRRFFIFPGLSLEESDCASLRLAMQAAAGRSVVLTPNTASAQSLAAEVERLEGFRVFHAPDLEANRTAFVAERRAAAILANRYDGIDFPNDECRLLCLEGLPRTMNAQERFLMSKMGASALFNERIQTRVLQAVGRCTRALQDRSAVLVTGGEMVDYLADSRNWEYFHPELQAELFFGVDQSRETSARSMYDNFRAFLENRHEWQAANGQILSAARTRRRAPYPAMDALSNVVSHEIGYQAALWHNDYERALSEARMVRTGLDHPELRGYRALWHYLQGLAAHLLAHSPDDDHARLASEQFLCAKRSAPYVSWMSRIAREQPEGDDLSTQQIDTDTLDQVDRLETRLRSLGTAHDHKFEKLAAAILNGILDGSRFEDSQRMLGRLLGFIAGNDESHGAPDPWWLGTSTGIVFEDHSNAESTTVLGANKARQAASHPLWMTQNVPEADGLAIVSVLVTPCTRVNSGAIPHLTDVLLWPIDDFRQWASRAIARLRELKSAMPPESSLKWRQKACRTLEDEGLTVLAIQDMLGDAASTLEIVG